jgi:uncharacterized protein YjbI with pentapeptide repeats
VKKCNKIKIINYLDSRCHSLQLNYVGLLANIHINIKESVVSELPIIIRLCNVNFERETFFTITSLQCNTSSAIFEVQIYKCKFTSANLQVQIYKCKFTSANLQVQI